MCGTVLSNRRRMLNMKETRILSADGNAFVIKEFTKRFVSFWKNAVCCVPYRVISPGWVFLVGRMGVSFKMVS